jgi:hypothetical protein
MSFDRIVDAAAPDNIIANHKRFPKSDMCNDLEYSLFLIKRESMYCVTAKTPIATGSRNRVSSLLPRYTKSTTKEAIAAAIIEIISE